MGAADFRSDDKCRGDVHCHYDKDRDIVFAGRLEVVETGRRRRWSEAEKVRIVAESLREHRQESATARRHGILNSLLFASPRASDRLTLMYTLIVTAKLTDIDPQGWPADVLDPIAELPHTRLDELCPRTGIPSLPNQRMSAEPAGKRPPSGDLHRRVKSFKAYTKTPR